MHDQFNMMIYKRSKRALFNKRQTWGKKACVVCIYNMQPALLSLKLLWVFFGISDSEKPRREASQITSYASFIFQLLAIQELNEVFCSEVNVLG
jgi:hypothetical protein